MLTHIAFFSHYFVESMWHTHREREMLHTAYVKKSGMCCFHIKQLACIAYSGTIAKYGAAMLVEYGTNYTQRRFNKNTYAHPYQSTLKMACTTRMLHSSECTTVQRHNAHTYSGDTRKMCQWQYNCKKQSLIRGKWDNSTACE